jgi:hypothetical protein
LKLNNDAPLRSLDELFAAAQTYGSSKEYQEFLDFVTRFRWYSPYNAMLVHVQKPGAQFVLTGSKWLSRHGRRIKPGAQPLVMLQPMGPVMFVFDVSDTEGEVLPELVEEPFSVTEGAVGQSLDLLIANCTRDGIRVTLTPQGSQSAGSISVRRLPESPRVGTDGPSNGAPVPIRYELVLNQNHSPETRFATLAHELAHLYCGHIGTLNPAWWPDRRGLSTEVMEFEAESVAYVVCGRQGLKTPAERYLHTYLEREDAIPAISLDRVLKVAGLLEGMATNEMKPRKSRQQ